MSPVQISLVVHVVAAVLGTGPVAALALAAREESPPLRTVRVLGQVVGFASGLVLLSGLWLGVATHVYHAMWFRAAFVLFLLFGAAHGVSSSGGRALARGDGDRARALRKLRVGAYVACALVAAITVLMAWQPG